MSYIVCDPGHQRACIWDGTQEQPLRGASFLGANAATEGDSFLGYLHTEHNLRKSGVVKHPTDPRAYEPNELSLAHDRWRELCLDSEDQLNTYGWELAEFTWMSGTGTAPEPPDPEEED